ncbi:MAG: calcium-translocating P-type ATPase, SERCA-type [Candidatus Aenigmarchaeota archaeon]|nr:calcium-translocating P-type ATPase, SERCA-type [Candidatus Aenigmarchaeota archaeon]
MTKPLYQLPVAEALQSLETQQTGLSEQVAQQRLEQYGPNQLKEQKRTSAIALLLEQFKNILVLVLVASAIISFFLGQMLDAIVIVGILIVNALIGFYQEQQAQKAIESLRKFTRQKSKVYRNGKLVVLDASLLVPGDVIELETGDIVPADARVLEAYNLKTQEAVLTGESTPVSKHIDIIEKDVVIADQKNMVFSGTVVSYGRCTAVIAKTGMETEFGKIAKSLQEPSDLTPLQKKLDALGNQLTILIGAVVAIVFVVGMLRNFPILEIFMTAVSLSVAAIPEGLPAIVTITLAVGLLRMAKKQVIIRKLPAAETLGAATVICSDKTGTMTKNEMTVRKLYANGRIIDVSGQGYETTGTLTYENQPVIQQSPDVELLLKTGLLCNNADLEGFIGDPTELALIVSALKYGIPDLRKQYAKKGEIPFESERKRMSVVYEIDHQRYLFTKGAPEEILAICTTINADGEPTLLTNEHKRQALAANKELASHALRVLGFAYKKLRQDEEPHEETMTFIGLQGMIDPPRPEVKDAIQKCRDAGIKVVMITGDHKETAIAVAKEIDLIQHDEDVLTGEELNAMSDEELQQRVEHIAVYARVAPDHKSRITVALKQRGHIVAMTGDGVNDAPALKKSDLGIAVGAATDITKETSDMVLLDNNFSSIVAAIEEGRNIFDNIRKFVLYLLSANIAEVFVIAGSIFIGLPLPLVPVQILWMNLLTDGLPALGLGFEPPEENIMKRKPRNPQEKILTKENFMTILFVGILITLATMWIFWTELGNVTKAETMAFTTIVLLELIVAISFRSRQLITKIGLFSNMKLLLAIASSVVLQVAVLYVPFLTAAFGTVPLGLADWGKIVLVLIPVFLALEFRKIV